MIHNTGRICLSENRVCVIDTQAFGRKKHSFLGKETSLSNFNQTGGNLENRRMCQASARLGGEGCC